MLLRQLLQKDVKWLFKKPQIEAVDNHKKIIISQPILQYYNPHLPTKITTDTSKHRFGAVLEQMHSGKWKPISSTSKTPAEQNYCPIENETLQIEFACKKYH